MPLPADPSLLPPLGEEFWSTVDAGLAALGVELSAGARAALDAQARLLLAWNTQINLTALRDPEQVARRHLLDSLSAVPLARRLLARRPGGQEGSCGKRAGQPVTRRPPAAPVRLLDLGSGAGYPGLPLAVALPAADCALVDSVAKKARFLGVVAAAARTAMASAGEEPPVIDALAERAEDLADEPEHRERWSLVVARAVGSLAEVAELALPLLAIGGHLVAWKHEPGDAPLSGELGAAATVIRLAGGERASVAPVPADERLGLAGHVLVSVRKGRPTPARFPRAPAERRRPC